MGSLAKIERPFGVVLIAVANLLIYVAVVAYALSNYFAPHTSMYDGAAASMAAEFYAGLIVTYSIVGIIGVLGLLVRWRSLRELARARANNRLGVRMCDLLNNCHLLLLSSHIHSCGISPLQNHIHIILRQKENLSFRKVNCHAHCWVWVWDKTLPLNTHSLSCCFNNYWVRDECVLAKRRIFWYSFRCRFWFDKSCNDKSALV